MTQTLHPATPSDVTPGWLSQMLRSAGVLEDARITNAKTEIIGAERGFTGVIARIEIVCDGAAGNAPESVVVKFPLAVRDNDSSFRRVLGQSGGVPPQMMERAQREVDFYNFAGREVPGLPRCYVSHIDAGAGQALLVLEDLSYGSPGDALIGCSVNGVRAVLEAIGQVHARWWGDRSLSGIDWLGDWSATNQRRAERFRAQAPVVTETFAERLPQPVIRLIHDLIEPLDEILAALAEAPTTLIHGDLHLDNVIFLPDGERVTAGIIDWQGPARGPAVLDIAGFIAEALPIDERRARETELLRGYHDDLMGPAADDYGFDELYQDYRRALAVRVAGQVGWLARVIDHPPTGRERALVDALFDPGRVFTALLDHRGGMLPR